MNVRYTKYISISSISKEFCFNKSTKKKEKRSLGEMYDAQAIIIDSDLKTFGESLADMGSNEACSFGIPLPKFKNPIIQVTTNKRRAQYPTAMVRDNKDMTFRKGVPGIFFIDYDPSQYGGKPLKPKQFLKILFEVDPQLALCEYVLRGSVSAGVHTKGSKITAGDSFHLYFSITDMAAVPDYGKLLYDRLWLAGHGFMALSSVGGMMERTLVDSCVWQPNRLDFTGQPVIVSDELIYSAPEMTFVEGVSIDPKLLPKLTKQQLDDLLDRKQEQRKIRQPEVQAKKDAYVKKNTAAVMARGSSLDEAVLLLRERTERTVYELYAHDLLQFKNPELGDATVGEVFMDWKRFEGEALVDPDEDRWSYPDDSARFYWNKGQNPIVISWGHGGRNFKLFNTKKVFNGSHTNDGGNVGADMGDVEGEDEPVLGFGSGGQSKSTRNANNASGNSAGNSSAGGGGGNNHAGNNSHGNNSGSHSGGWQDELVLVTKVLAEMDTDTSAWSKSANMDGFLRALLVLEENNFEEYQKALVKLTGFKVKSEVDKKLKALRAADRAANRAANIGGNSNWKDELKNLVDEQNLVWRKTMLKKQAVVMKETEVYFKLGNESGWYAQIYWEFYKVKEMTEHYVGQGNFQYGEKPSANGPIPLYGNRFVAWNNSPDKTYYENGVVFLPGEEEEPMPGVFNLWRGFAYEPKKNPKLLKNLYSHMKEVICASDKVMYDYLLNWIAYTFQFPASLPEVALIWNSGEGSGKGSIAHFIRRVWGVHGFYASGAEGITGKHNSHMGQICFFIGDEVIFSGSKKEDDMLKPLITDGVLSIEPKGIDKYQQPNFLKLILLTNHVHSVIASDTVRRYAIFEVSDKRIADYEYFEAFSKELYQDDVCAAFLYDMLNRDITKFNPRQFPENDGIKNQRRASHEPALEWLCNCAEDGFFGDIESWDKTKKKAHRFNACLTPSELHTLFIAWGKDRGVTSERTGLVSRDSFSKKISKIFDRDSVRVDGAVKRIYKFKDLKTFRDTIESKLKVKLDY